MFCFYQMALRESNIGISCNETQAVGVVTVKARVKIVASAPLILRFDRTPRIIACIPLVLQ